MVIKTLTLILVLCVSAYSFTYYVRPDGDNSNDGSLGSPFETSGKICSTVVAGDTAYYLTGTFQEYWLHHSGRYGTLFPVNNGFSADSNITFYVHPESTVIIEGDTTTGHLGTAAHLSARSYIEINGFTCRYGYPAGIRGWTQAYNVIKNNHCYNNMAAANNNGGGIYVGLDYSHDVVVCSNTVHDNYRYPYSDEVDDWNTSGIHIYRCKDCDVYDNEMYNQPVGFGLRAKWLDTTVVVRNNVVRDCYIGIGLGTDADSLVAHNNLISDCVVGIEVRSEDGGTAVNNNNMVYNNTIFNSGIGIRILSSWATIGRRVDACSLWNNIVVDGNASNCLTNTTIADTTTSQIVDFYSDYNCWYRYAAPSGTIMNWFDSDNLTLPQFTAGFYHDSNSVQVNPFIDTVRASPTFGHLTAESPESVKTGGKNGEQMGAFEITAATGKRGKFRKSYYFDENNKPHYQWCDNSDWKRK